MSMKTLFNKNLGYYSLLLLTGADYEFKVKKTKNIHFYIQLL